MNGYGQSVREFIHIEYVLCTQWYVQRITMHADFLQADCTQTTLAMWMYMATLCDSAGV